MPKVATRLNQLSMVLLAKFSTLRHESGNKGRRGTPKRTGHRLAVSLPLWICRKVQTTWKMSLDIGSVSYHDFLTWLLLTLFQDSSDAHKGSRVLPLPH